MHIKRDMYVSVYLSIYKGVYMYKEVERENHEFPDLCPSLWPMFCSENDTNETTVELHESSLVPSTSNGMRPTLAQHIDPNPVTTDTTNA